MTHFVPSKIFQSQGILGCKYNIFCCTECIVLPSPQILSVTGLFISLEWLYIIFSDILIKFAIYVFTFYHHTMGLRADIDVNVLLYTVYTFVSYHI